MMAPSHPSWQQLAAKGNQKLSVTAAAAAAAPASSPSYRVYVDLFEKKMMKATCPNCFGTNALKMTSVMLLFVPAEQVLSFRNPSSKWPLNHSQFWKRLPVFRSSHVGEAIILSTKFSPRLWVNLLVRGSVSSWPGDIGSFQSYCPTKSQ